MQKAELDGPMTWSSGLFLCTVQLPEIIYLSPSVVLAVGVVLSSISFLLPSHIFSLDISGEGFAQLELLVLQAILTTLAHEGNRVSRVSVSPVLEPLTLIRRYKYATINCKQSISYET